MKHLLPYLFLLLPLAGFSQKIHFKNNGKTIDNKFETIYPLSHQLYPEDEADYTMEIIYLKKEVKTLGFKNHIYTGHYRLYDRSGKEVYRSEEWTNTGNRQTVDIHIIRDLPKALEKIK